MDQLLEDDLSTEFSLLNYLNNTVEVRSSDLAHSFICLFPIVTIKEDDDLYPKLKDIKDIHRHFLNVWKIKMMRAVFTWKAILDYTELIKQSGCISAITNILGLWLFVMITLRDYIDFEGNVWPFEIRNKTKGRKK